MNKGFTILLVDDRSANLESTGLFLRAHGYGVQETSDVGTAWQRLQQGHIDLVLTDVALKNNDGDGLWLLEQIRTKFSPSLPVIVYTAFSAVTDAVRAIRLGASDYLEFPLIPNDILNAIRAALARSEENLDYCPRNPVPAAIASLEQLLHSPNGLAMDERWALYVFRGVEAETDVRTLEAWARTAATSVTSLRELCYLLEVQPSRAKDFVRAARVFSGMAYARRSFGSLVRASDRRTIRSFCDSTGLDPTASYREWTFSRFVRSQHVLSATNDGVVAVLRWIEFAEPVP